MVDEIKACMKSSQLWRYVKCMKLKTNMRVQQSSNYNATMFSDYLLSIGNGNEKNVVETGNIKLCESLWLPHKELYNLVFSAVHKRDADVLPELESTLRRHKPDFIALLRNPPQNPESREAVRKASTEGIPVLGQLLPQVLSQQLVDEAFIVSNMFELNEVAAVELLLAGENQLPQFPGLTRGLVAIMLYYDGRRSIVAALRALIQAREGRMWTLGLSMELVTLATNYTDQLLEEGLITRILELLQGMDFAAEVDKLQTNRALGIPRYRKQVVDLITEIKQTLADCLYCWACQSALSREYTMQIHTFAVRFSPTAPDSSLDNVSLALLMALLYTMDVSLLQQMEDGDALDKKLPIRNDPDFVAAIHKELTNQLPWANSIFKPVLQFAWAVTLRILSQQPNAQVFSQYYEEDETVLDMAVDSDVFFILHNYVLSNTTFHNEEFYVKRIHNLVTDFIIHMPLKVKELRNRGDETARIISAHQNEGLEPPANLPRHFENMLQLVAVLYEKDPLKLELMKEYWCPMELSPGFSTMYPSRPPQRQVSLYKFVRLAGDLVPPPLYIPYVRMLTSLSNSPACGHHCFNLLKLNGSSPGGHCSTVSWDHFFQSLHRYYTNLRQEVPLSSDTQHIYRQRPLARGITPTELEGLAVVLKLMRTVADKDEIARVAMCENQQWGPLAVLLGLVTCSVPSSMKAELLLTLASFALSPAIAANMWHSVEVAQVLQTIKTTSTYQSSGIQIELDEIEARNEEFPMTRAFLKLLNTLVDIPIPPSLGAGFRAPGFDPYFEFIRDSVFLKFNTRSYKNPGEKWQVAAACLRIFYKLLCDHEVLPEDFTNQVAELQGGGSTVVNKRPGHNVLVHMLHDGGMVKTVLYIIDEAVRLLDLYSTFSGKENLELSSLLCLKLINCVLAKQGLFFDLLRDCGAPLLVNSMDKLLLGINPRSGRPDHLVRITKFLTYSSLLPEHALAVVKILTAVCESTIVQPQLVTLFTSKEAEKRLLLHGFVESLELEDSDEEAETVMSEIADGESSNQVHNLIRQSIIQLLLLCLPQSAPNLAHFLLGFELRKPVSKSQLQEPGVLGSPRTCLHAVLSFLSHGADSRSGPTCVFEAPAMAEKCYHLVYDLCFNRETSGPTLRYLRTTHDFLYRQLQHVPFKSRETGITNNSSVLIQQSWLLKTIAVELRVTSLNRQRSHVQRLFNLLIDDSQESISQAGLLSTEQLPDGEFPATHETSIISMSQLRPSNVVTGSHVRRKLLCILDTIEFSQQYPEAPQWEYFDAASIEQVINRCEQRHPSGLVLVSAQQLHQVLLRELNEFQGVASLGQRPLIVQEIQNILRYVVKKNMVRKAVHAKRQAFDAWRQVTEVIFTSCPSDLLEGERRQTVLFEIIQELLHKALDQSSLPELSNLAAGVILTLLTNLRQCFMTMQMATLPTPDTTSYLSLLDKSAGSTQHLHSSSLQVVLRGLLECILKAGVGPQRVRANYYSALLNFLRIAQKPKELPTLTGEVASSPLINMDQEMGHEKLIRENMEVILSCGEHFMEVVCRDCCTGHDIGRMLAIASLDLIVSMDPNQHWLAYLTSKGYLRHLVESLLQDDEQLQNLISLTPEPFRVLYLYESKMALLVRFASSIAGASSLLENGIMSTLAECKVFDLRPEPDPNHNQTSTSFSVLDDSIAGSEEEGFLSSAMGRYRQILFPALRLCLAISTVLGKDNANASNQVLKFVIAHVDVFCTILRERHSVLSLPVIQELSLATRVIARAAIEEPLDNVDMDATMLLEVRGQVKRLQRLMLALLQRYALTDALLQHLTTGVPSGLPQHEARLALLEVVSSVLTHCQSYVSLVGHNPRYCPILFLPNLVEAITRETFSMKDCQTMVNSLRLPNLGIIVYHLQQCTTLFMQTYDAQKNYVRKLNKLPELGPDEMKEFLPNYSSIEKLSGQTRKQTVRQCLLTLLSYKAREIKLYAYMIETLLFLLWRHLEYFLVSCSPADPTSTPGSRSPRHHRPFDLTYSITGSNDQSHIKDISITQDELLQLKADTLTAVNETLFKKLQEIAQVYTRHRTHCSFLEALVRRVKRLVRLHTK